MIDWCVIPSGEIEIAGKRHHVPQFDIGRFPVTTSQFDRFVQEGGYGERQWWTDAGWTWREDEDVSAPAFWLDPYWHLPDHPVVGVLWHEAIAFCNWLAGTTGEKILLPTELQRERAARGNGGRAFPWGETFDSNRCNSAESGIGKTTPVDRYSEGQSELGVFDLSGNVWEWCLDEWDPRGPSARFSDHGQSRTLRGGSFFDTSLAMLCEIRARYRSESRLPYVGFRVSRSAE